MTQPSVTPGSIESKENFKWTFQGRVIVADNGARFTSNRLFKGLMELNTFMVICFDPQNRLAEREDLADIDGLKIAANTTLGNGEPVTLYHCANKATSATLKPLASTLASTQASGDEDGPNRVLEETLIASVALDELTALEVVDWMLLDERNNNIAILQNARKALPNTLLVDVRIPFQFSHENQADYTLIHHFLSDYGFRFFRFQDLTQKSDFPTDIYLEQSQASETQTMSGLFLPTEARLAAMSKNDLLKLGFILHTSYQLKDTAYKMLSHVDADLAREYLISEGFLWPVDENETEFVLTESYSPDIWAKELAL